MLRIFGMFKDTKTEMDIPKNTLSKPRIVVFFHIFFRKFWHLVKLNMLFFVFNLPAVVVMPFVAQFFYQR